MEQTDIKEIEITTSDEVKKGVYANNAFISTTHEEVIMDFVTIVPPSSGTLTARVILSLSHAKRLAHALNENLKKHEETFGEIPLEKQPLKS